MARIGKRAYAEIFGPTVGDRVRLADTDLLIEVEADHTLRAGGYGDEVKFGGGKTIRDGMGQSQVVNGPGHHEAADCVITNALIVDHWGIVKADIGIKGSRIAAIGKAGNPDVMDGVDIVIGPGTEIIAGEGMIVTAGGIDSHIHFICPQQIDEALYSGITTMLGGGTGPATGTFATTCTPGPENLHRMLQAADAFPMNLGFLGKGNAVEARGAEPADRRRRHRPEAARGLGHHARGHQQLPGHRRGHRHAGVDPLRHAQRERLRRGHHRRHARAHAVRLPHRRRRRRPRARHPARGGRGQLPAEFHQPDDALHRQHGGRASGHADGVPPPRCEHRRGPGLRREPHPPRDHRRRRRAARPGRDQHDVVGQPGDGACRRGHPAHLADGAQDEAAARRAGRRFGAGTTTRA